MTRRRFLEKGAFGFGAAFLATGIPRGNKLSDLPPGFQVWTIREDLQKDFPGTLKKIASMGYKTVEMCSPPGYGWKKLTGISPGEMKKIINDAGLEFESTHYTADEFRNNLDERIDFAARSGQKQMILSSFGLSRKATLDDWKKAADDLNSYAERSRRSGIQMGFHNHHGEFQELEGKLIYDVLMDILDPDLVKMQFQVAVINIGYKAADYFRKYPGRFISAHLADYSPEKKKDVALGRGIVDWKEFFGAAKTGGLKNIFVEMDPETFKESADFIAALQ